jgi:hypothetical protein
MNSLLPLANYVSQKLLKNANKGNLEKSLPFPEIKPPTMHYNALAK